MTEMECDHCGWAIYIYIYIYIYVQQHIDCPSFLLSNSHSAMFVPPGSSNTRKQQLRGHSPTNRGFEREIRDVDRRRDNRDRGSRGRRRESRERDNRGNRYRGWDHHHSYSSSKYVSSSPVYMYIS